MGFLNDVACQQLCTLITLKVFNYLVSLAYGNKMDNNNNRAHTLKDEEKNTVSYIGGCIIKKIKQRMICSPKTEVQDKKMHCLSLLVCSKKDTVQNQMTLQLDRGGLTYIKPGVAKLFFEAETTFQDMVGGKDELKVKSICVSNFLQRCLSNQIITSSFYEAVNECNNTVKEDIIGEILDTILILFFKIRIHHKLKVVMDSIRKQENKSKKEKSLRKKLKTSHPTETQ